MIFVVCDLVECRPYSSFRIFSEFFHGLRVLLSHLSRKFTCCSHLSRSEVPPLCTLCCACWWGSHFTVFLVRSPSWKCAGSEPCRLVFSPFWLDGFLLPGTKPQLLNDKRGLRAAGRCEHATCWQCIYGNLASKHVQVDFTSFFVPKT